ncbi:MAG TPA: recombination mediator RecR [Candidatus Parcubacteria bacterium]|nr:recombination mediator RecR [Candidatus Parcubacteria bacterium]
MYPQVIEKLIERFSKFPTIGPRTAARFVFYLMSLSQKEVEELTELIMDFKKSIKFCNFCFNPFEGKEDLCHICKNPKNANNNLLCIVEKEQDLIAIEKTKKYSGLYFILGGTISKLEPKNLKSLRIEELKERIKNPQKFRVANENFKEIILALNPTTEGEATALYLERELKSLRLKITRLGRGLPTGGELEYADEETLSSAFEGRK